MSVLLYFPTRLVCFEQYDWCNILNKWRSISKELFEDLLTTLQEGSLCAHGGGIPLPVKNAMQYFENELKEYFD